MHSDLWIAPGHSFDRTTVSILRELGVTSISDGYSISPYTDKQGIFWIPQQLSEKQILSVPGGKPSELKSAGVWTVCIHPNAWTRAEINQFRQAARRYRHLIRTTGEIRAAYGERQKDWRDRIHSAKLDLGRRLRLLIEGKTDVRIEAPPASIPACAGSSRDASD